MSSLTGIVSADTALVQATVQNGPNITLTNVTPTINVTVRNAEAVAVTAISGPEIKASIQSGPTIVTQVIATGPAGKDGLSAYEIWLSEGNQGTVTDFLSSISSVGYIYEQMVASSAWTISHPLKKFPSVTIVDSAGNIVFGDVAYLSDSQITITFTAEFSGKAYLN